jgi:bifunctional ADP-heptose synthase (sugar kinase/adenylyltransferase)
MDTPQQKRFKVLLIGDSCEDEYIYGRCERISPEAPVPVMNFSKIEKRAGMAENVFYNLKSFGLNVGFLTNSEKIIKTRFIDEKSNQQILRVDKENKISPLSEDIDFNFFDAIAISDYNKGFLTKDKLFEIVESTNIPIFIDSKKTHLPNKKNCFIKINDLEYNNLKEDCNPKNLIITKGSKGCLYKDKLYEAEKVNVYDVVGAGDTFLSALVYGYLKFNSIEDAIILANKAAAIAVQNPGTYVLTKEDVKNLCN